MRDLNEIECFIMAVKSKSFTMAAKKMGIPKSTLSRKVKKLEERLKVTLLIRTTRSIHLTEEGKLYFDKLASIFKGIDHVEDLISNKKEKIEGTLRITVPLILGSGEFIKILSDFTKEYSDVYVDFVATDELIDLVDDGFDLGIRVGALKDSSLVSRQIQLVENKIITTPKMLKKIGSNHSINKLDPKYCLAFSPKGSVFPWNLKNKTAKKTIIPNSKLKVNHLQSLKDALLNDLGFALLPTVMVSDELKNGELVIAFQDWSSESVPVQIVYPAQKYVAPKVRAFVDFLGRVGEIKA